jgi:hypothetical protein
MCIVRNNSMDENGPTKRFNIEHSMASDFGGFAITTTDNNCVKAVMGFAPFEVFSWQAR